MPPAPLSALSCPTRNLPVNISQSIFTPLFAMVFICGREKSCRRPLGAEKFEASDFRVSS